MQRHSTIPHRIGRLLRRYNRGTKTAPLLAFACSAIFTPHTLDFRGALGGPATTAVGYQQASKALTPDAGIAPDIGRCAMGIRRNRFQTETLPSSSLPAWDRSRYEEGQARGFPSKEI